jgi:peptidoglycan hydrolase-like protein with peptidoglycan-binding domain
MKSQRAGVGLSIAFSVVALFVSCPAITFAGTIDSTDHYAWSNNGGWVNWNPTNGGVQVTSSALTGYIWSADFGWINLAPTNGGVTNNGQGVLGGYAWGENVGWISFTGVTIDSNGVFHGETTAQPTFGTMTFDCTNCSVVTTWRPSTSNGGSTPAGGGGGIVGLISGVGGSAAAALPYNGGAAPTGGTTSAGSSASASVPSHEFTATLQIGSTGQGVTQLQQILIADGYLSISAPTSYFGSKTEAAVKAFQKANGLDQIGIVGPKTRAILNQGSTPPSSETTATTPSSTSTVQQLSLVQQLWQELQSLLAEIAALQGQATSTATSTTQ